MIEHRQIFNQHASGQENPEGGSRGRIRHKPLCLKRLQSYHGNGKLCVLDQVRYGRGYSSRAIAASFAQGNKAFRLVQPFSCTHSARPARQLSVRPRHFNVTSALVIQSFLGKKLYVTIDTAGRHRTDQDSGGVMSLESLFSSSATRLLQAHSPLR